MARIEIRRRVTSLGEVEAVVVFIDDQGQAFDITNLEVLGKS